MQKSCKFVAWKYIGTQHKTLIKRKLISKPRGVGREKTLSYATRWSFVSKVGWKTLFRDSGSISRDCRHANCPRATRASAASHHTNENSAITSSCRDNSACMLGLQCSWQRHPCWSITCRGLIRGRLSLVRVSGSVQGTIISGNDYFVCSARQSRINLTRAVTIVRVRIIGRELRRRVGKHRDMCFARINCAHAVA